MEIALAQMNVISTRVSARVYSTVPYERDVSFQRVRTSRGTKTHKRCTQPPR